MDLAVGSISATAIDHLAELTQHRDRELLDVTLTRIFRELLGPRCVAVYRKVGEGDSARWMTRARLCKDDAVPTADPIWTPLKNLPLLSEYPLRRAALSGRIIASTEADAFVTVFPLASDREVNGVLELVTDGAPNGDAHRIVCSILSVYRNFEGVLDYSERDTLTGLLNRRTFDETFLKIITSSTHPTATHGDRRCATDQAPYWVGMIDIDHFKSVNDKHGHLIGDEVLLLQSRVMRSSFRYEDRLYRFGGEEFVALIRCPSEPDAARAFERLRQNTAGFSFPQVGQVTVSIGFAEVKASDSPSSALGRADRCVYFAKSHGRNQVRGFAELLARGDLTELSPQVGSVDLF